MHPVLRNAIRFAEGEDAYFSAKQTNAPKSALAEVAQGSSQPKPAVIQDCQVMSSASKVLALDSAFHIHVRPSVGRLGPMINASSPVQEPFATRWPALRPS